MVERRGPQVAKVFLDDFGRLVAVLVPRNGRLEIARVGKPVGADRAQLGQAERQPVVLRDIAARFAVQELDAKLHAPWDETDRAGRDLKPPEFGLKLDGA